MTPDHSALIERLERPSGNSNELDVLIEIALFEPDATYASARPNAAGTKVIYTHTDGTQATYWAPEWTRKREHAIAALKSLPSAPNQAKEAGE